MKATDNQVDGTHYNQLKIQPIQLGYALNASPCFVKLAKYITRDKGDKHINLTKAIHVTQLEEEVVDSDNLYFMEDKGLRKFGSINEDRALDLIYDFSEQFSYSEIIYDALADMFYGQHDEVIGHVQRLAEKY